MDGTDSTNTEILIQLMAELSEMTGSVIGTETDENGNTYLTEIGCKTEDCEKSEKADSYVSFLLNDQSSNIKLMNNNINTRKTKKGNDAKDFGSQAYLTGEVYIDLDQINGFKESLKDAGVDERTMNVAYVFLHETLHTIYGASYYRDDGKNFVDPKGFSTTFDAGETVAKVNEFRREMGLPERATYGGHNPGSIRFKLTDGSIINVKMKR